METVVLRLVRTDWADHLDRAEFFLLAGIILGGFFGHSRLNKRVVALLGLGYSLVITGWQFGRMMGTGIPWLDRIINLSGRLSHSTHLFSSNQPVKDPLLFVFCISILFWCLGFCGGYFLVRKEKPWLPLLGAGIILIIVEIYSPGVSHGNLYSGAFFYFILVLAGRMFFINSRREWENKGGLMDGGAGNDLAKAVLTISLILILAAWKMPTLFDLISTRTKTHQMASEFWQPLRDRLQNAVAALRSTPILSGIDPFDSVLNLGTETPQGDEPVFIAETNKGRLPGLNYYWRGRSYDLYEGGIWSNTINNGLVVQPNDWPLPRPEWENRQAVEVTLTMQKDISQLVYLPGYPLYVSRPINIFGFINANKNTLDPTSIMAEEVIRGGETINGETWVSVPSANRLLTAGDLYPVWVTDFYLQLPKNLSADIFKLAGEITQGMETPFEKTRAITQYLRENIQYQTSITAPPTGQDPIEWFLFEARSGYCNYYATAEVLMLRTLGIPSRMTVGFSQGEPLDHEFTYKILTKHGHAWPEVYFPGTGWVEFEPTSSVPTTEYFFTKPEDQPEEPDSSIIRPSGQNPERGKRLGELEEIEIGQSTENNFHPGIAILLVIAFCVLAVLGVYSMKHPGWYKENFPKMIENAIESRGYPSPKWLNHLGQYVSFSKIEKYFFLLFKISGVLGIYSQVSDTPTEKINTLTAFLPEVKTEAEALLEEYQKDAYSQQPGDPLKARQAFQILLKEIIKWKMG